MVFDLKISGPDIMDNMGSVKRESSAHRGIYLTPFKHLELDDNLLAYKSETVEAPPSPNVMRFLDNIELTNYAAIEGGDPQRTSASSSNSDYRKGEEDEYYDDEEEYYEDYTLPTTHQNVMSSRRSFRRKLEADPAPEDPDSERIERVVKAGELQRHNSIRRKIIPQPEDFTDQEVILRSKSGRLDQLPEQDDEGNCESINTEITKLEDMLNERPESLKFEGSEHLFTPLEAGTISRIQECLNAERFKDLYHLGSRLQDLLSTVEIDEIVRNGDKFSSVIDPEIVRILSKSVSASPSVIENVLQSEQLVATKAKKKILPSEPIDMKQGVISALSPINSESEEEEEVKRATPDLISKRPLAPTFSVGSNQPVMNFPAKSAVTRPGNLPSPISRLKTKPTQDLGYHAYPSVSSNNSNGSSRQFIGKRISPEDIVTPDDLEESILERLPPRPDLIPETSPYEEREDDRRWRNVVISGLEKRLDVRVIEPYKKVLSHGGYAGQNRHTAIIVFGACHLPDRSRKDYDYVMDNLFLYVLITLDALVAEDYILVYLHGATPRSCMPSLGWIRRCYQLVDRRLRKNLKTFYIVHPTLWLKTLVTLAKPFVSSKFSRKLTFVTDLVELEKTLPIDPLSIPDRVKQYDAIKQALEHGV